MTRLLPRSAAIVVFLVQGASIAAPPRETTEVTVCDLLSHPGKYRNTRVRITGIVVADFDAMALEDEECRSGSKAKSQISLTADVNAFVRYAPGWKFNDYSAAVSADSAHNTRMRQFEWVEPLQISRVPQAQIDAMLSTVREHYFEPVRVVLVGRFDYSNGGLVAESRGGDVGWSPGFGRRGAFARQIAIERIEKVEVVGR